MKTPSHQAISQRAYEIWQAEGHPDGRDTEIWLNAEQQLSTASTKASPPAATRSAARPPVRSSGNTPVTADRIKSETAAESAVEYNISPAVSEDDAVKAALQTQGPGAPSPGKTVPPAVIASQVRGDGRSQSSATAPADPKPVPVKPAPAKTFSAPGKPA